MQLCYFNRGEMNLAQMENVEKRLRFPFLDLIETSANYGRIRSTA
jgi:hypothetical protein